MDAIRDELIELDRGRWYRAQPSASSVDSLIGPPTGPTAVAPKPDNGTSEPSHRKSSTRDKGRDRAGDTGRMTELEGFSVRKRKAVRRRRSSPLLLQKRPYLVGRGSLAHWRGAFS